MGENSRGGKANLNVELLSELRVSGGREFQSLGAMTEKALLPRGHMVWTETIMDGQNR